MRADRKNARHYAARVVRAQALGFDPDVLRMMNATRYDHPRKRFGTRAEGDAA